MCFVRLRIAELKSFPCLEGIFCKLLKPQFQTITIDKGEADGLDKGTVLSLYKRKLTMRVDLSNNFKSGDTVGLISTPAEEVGLAMVYRTSEHLNRPPSFWETISDISVGDFRRPIRDAIWTIYRIRAAAA